MELEYLSADMSSVCSLWFQGEGGFTGPPGGSGPKGNHGRGVGVTHTHTNTDTQTTYLVGLKAPKVASKHRQFLESASPKYC